MKGGVAARNKAERRADEKKAGNDERKPKRNAPRGRERIPRKREVGRKTLERTTFDGVRRVGDGDALGRLRRDGRPLRVGSGGARRRVDACFFNVCDDNGLRVARDRLGLARKPLSPSEIGVPSPRLVGVAPALGDGGGRRGGVGDERRRFGLRARLGDGVLRSLRRLWRGAFRSTLGRERRERVAARVGRRRGVAERKNVD